jgi:pimeloyl-ACP methyl ester carboxylesterase
VACLLLSLLSLAGCASGSPTTHAAALAGAAGFHRLDIPTAEFRLLSYIKGSGPIARVYIEGDGHAWRDRFTPSDDPTPFVPVGLELAAADPSPTVAWLARPCQYLASENRPICAPIWWTGWRYHETVIAGMSEALDRIREVLRAEHVELVGFSGGGAVAALVAARRSDVISLRTVAANLDTAFWTARHQVSPLDGSLNPADFAARLGALPQRHFVGADDDVVESAVTRSYLARLPSARCATAVVVPGIGHDASWRAIWPGLLQQPIGCRDVSHIFIHHDKFFAKDALDFPPGVRNNRARALRQGDDS